jgi:hypothetical protein
MKKILWLLAVIFTVSCSEDGNNEPVYQTYGVVREDTNTSGKLYIRSDKGKIIVPASSLLSIDDRNSRVWMLFHTDDDVNNSDTIKANIHEFLRITEIDFNAETVSTSNDVFLKEIWVAQDYLTLIMNVSALNEDSLEKHKYTMYSDWETVNDTVYMEFKYDRNNDSGNVQFNKIVALRLDDKITNSESVVLAIKYLTNTGYKDAFVTYKK